MSGCVLTNETPEECWERCKTRRKETWQRVLSALKRLRFATDPHSYPGNLGIDGLIQGWGFDMLMEEKARRRLNVYNAIAAGKRELPTTYP